MLKAPKMKKAGAVTIAFGGIAASLTASDAREWLELIREFSPILISGWLLYVIYNIDQEREALRIEVAKLKVQVARLELSSGITFKSHASGTEDPLTLVTPEGVKTRVDAAPEYEVTASNPKGKGE